MKKIFNVFLVLLLGLLFTTNVCAKEQDVYYTNENGISFTREEYEFFTKMYYDGFQAIMNENDLAKFDGIELNPNNVERVEYDDGTSITEKVISTRSTTHETNAKKLTISSASGAYPVVAVTLQWKGNPNVRSYDVMGVRYTGSGLVSNLTAVLNYSGGSYSSNERVVKSNGSGVSIKLPNSGSNIVVSETFSVYSGQTIYASYQHAKSSISLANSKKYSISSAGYGSVFLFNSGISSKYDGMGGVYIGV